MGSTGFPLTRTSKWRWQPVDHPVVPTVPIRCPRVTDWPEEEPRALWCA